MRKGIWVLNGPSLNLLGVRRPEIYGRTTLKEIQAQLEERCQREGVPLVFHQTNHEGTLIDLLHEAREKAAVVLLNPGAYAHTSIALRDAIEAVEVPVIEVHLSNPQAREPFRRHSFVAEVARGVVAGFGALSYRLALEAALGWIQEKEEDPL
ncbi:MAG: type II 3-dehydroquinate dehydratase [Bacillota bacterium]|nr:type II 3-dehydroquinate dehydratase [Bacillota bacterium]